MIKNKFNNFVKKNECVVIISNINRFWILQKNCTFGIIVFFENKFTLFVDNRYYEALKDNKIVDNVIKYLSFDTYKDFIINNKIKKIYYEGNITVNEYNTFIKSFNMKEECIEFKKLRIDKTADEIKNISKACKIAADSIQYAIDKIIKVGITEKEVRKEIIKYYYDCGCDNYSFLPIIAFGKNSAVPHHQSNDTKLKKNDIILIDTGCVWNGYCSDITRTFCYGKPSKEFISMWNKVYEAQTSAIKQIKTKIKTSSLDKICRDIIDSSEFKGLFIHSTGHGVGIEIHELPNIRATVDDITDNNYVFTIEPGIYKPGLFGIRIEDTLCIIDNKVINLTKSMDKKQSYE